MAADNQTTVVRTNPVPISVRRTIPMFPFAPVALCATITGRAAGGSRPRARRAAGRRP